MKPLLPALLLLATANTACNRPATPAPAAAAAGATAPTTAAPAAAPADVPADAPAAGNSQTVTVPITLIDERGTGAAIGSIQLSDTPAGLRFEPRLSSLPPGPHGFHVHEFPDCSAGMKDGKMMAGAAAGEHYDPTGSGKHAGPDQAGHAGDLPRLVAGADGTVTASFVASRLKLSQVSNRSLMIHAEADDYGAAPGGARIACGVVR